MTAKRESARRGVDLSPETGDRTAYTTCYMCACRCGIRVHLKEGAVRYIDGNPAHPVNRGVLCAKGSAGIMHHNSPARLSKPLKRVGERGSGEFEEIEWEEALRLAASWLAETRRTDPRRLAFFTGRDQSQALTGWWASQFGTPNYASHGGFCSVNMAAAGLYTFGGSFWEFGEPDWEHTRYFMLFGVAEDHASNPLKTQLGRLKSKGVKIVSVNPVQTGYSAIADEWVGIRPGTDGMFVAALIHELLHADRIDLDYLVRYTNAPWLVVQDPGADDDGKFARESGKPLTWDNQSSALVDASLVDISPAVVGHFTLRDGRRAVPAFHLLAERFMDPSYGPDAAAPITGVPAEQIRHIAAELGDTAFEQVVELDRPWTDWAGRPHDKTVGRPVSMHAMRGISAHSNGFHTCRLLHLLQILLGSIDTPGGFRYKPPYPKPTPPGPKPAGHADQIVPGRPMAGAPLGFPTGPEDLLVDDDGTPRRIDKAYSWEAPLAAHGLMHTVIANAARGDPYPIDILFLFMANMAWNSSLNVPAVLEALTAKDPETGDYKIPKIIVADTFFSETVPYADLVLPDTTYLERWDCISHLDRPIGDPDGAADAIRHPVVEPDRDVRPFQSVLLDLGARLGLPGMINEDGSPRYSGGYPDYIVHHERQPGVGPLCGWRGTRGDEHGRGSPNPEQLDRYIENQGFWRQEFDAGQKYYKHANRDYLALARDMGWIEEEGPIIFQLYAETLQSFRLAARGHGPRPAPPEHRSRIEVHFDPLPFWSPPVEEDASEPDAYPFHAISVRPMAMYHSWGSQNAWLRQIHGDNALFVNRTTGHELGLGDGDWVWIESRDGRVKAEVKLMDGVNRFTVWTWNAIAKRAGAWNLAPDAPEARRGFLLNQIISELQPARNGGFRYTTSDPITGQAAWYDLKVRLRKVAPDESSGRTQPTYPTLRPPRGLPRVPGVLRFGRQFR